MSIQTDTIEPKTDPKPAAQAASIGEALAPKEPETSAAGNEPPAETSAAESETVETEEVEVKPGEEITDETKPTEGKKKGGFQKRIDKLNKRVSEKEQELEYWKAQALKASSTPAVQAPTDTPKPVAAEGKPKPESFETHAEYVEALTDWKTDQKFKEHTQKLEQSRIESERAKVNQTHNERVKAFAEKTADFHEMLENLESVPRSAALEAIIVSSENGPELLYELAKDPEEAKRIALLNPLAAAKELGRIEARLSSATIKKPESKTTKAPQPLTPVKGGGAASIPKSLDEAANSSFAVYKKLRDAEIKKRRQA